VSPLLTISVVNGSAGSAVIMPSSSRPMNGVPLTTAMTGLPPRPITSSRVTLEVAAGVPGRGVGLAPVQPGSRGGPAKGSGLVKAGPTTRNCMQSPSGRVGLTTPGGKAVSSSTACADAQRGEVDDHVGPLRRPDEDAADRLRESSRPSSTPIWVIGTTLLNTRS
jgi:hypothetical protein